MWYFLIRDDLKLLRLTAKAFNMNQGKYVFAQLTEFLPRRVFDTIVQKHGGNKYVKFFTCWNQLLCMMFGQLSNRDSLRDLMLALDAHSSKSYHLGLGKQVTRSNLAKANAKRASLIFEEFAYHMITIARSKCRNVDLGIDSQVYLFDSTTIDLCLSVFWWATFRKNKGGIKMHTLYDANSHIPVFMHITAATVHDVNAMDQLSYEQGSFYVFDRGYLDYGRLCRLNNAGAYFVIRAKSNLKFGRMYSKKADKENGVLCDQIGKLTGYHTSRDYPQKIRRVKFYDSESKRTFVFLTNNMDVTASEIALLYRHRWAIELFFKWIKQHLKIKSFWGTTENAVRIQIFAAITTYCLVAIVAQDLKTGRQPYEILQVLGISLLDKTSINELLTKSDYRNIKERIVKQLSLSLF